MLVEQNMTCTMFSSVSSFVNIDPESISAPVPHVVGTVTQGTVNQLVYFVYSPGYSIQ